VRPRIVHDKSPAVDDGRIAQLSDNQKPDLQNSSRMPPVEKPKIIAVMPAYNAETTLERTLQDIPPGTVDEIILVDDCSRDRGLHGVCGSESDSSGNREDSGDQ